MSLSKVYNPQSVENKWYQKWLENNYFHAEVDQSKKPYCIVIPPPNVTGVLHLGHALDETLQDILIRWRRMQGYNALWLPGTDHAGIATQAKVEEALAKEGLSKDELGREEFLKRVWAWKEEYGGTIISQLKRLGSSCDWERERFTMDEGCSQAVREVFVRLYEKGLIYQGSYLVNWCPKCHTTISDIEVEHEPRDGNLWHIKYPLVEGTGYIEVATTRPETMLGDTAVAVNPKDSRYQNLIGKEVLLPLVNRPIPIIADAYVDMEFGTGAVKITPAHDVNDFEMGQRHQLPQITVIGFDAKMTAEAGAFAGLDRYECRQKVVAELEKIGLLIKVESHSHAVGQCYRCDNIVEPLISKQWFVKMPPLAKPAIKAVVEGEISYVPERFTKIYLGWLENIRDWCISRQLWWGHRIPVWYCGDCGATLVSREDLTKCSQCESANLEQDPDVLDTWFSSALWPFSTLGWPEQTPELDYFYPTSVLVTGRDIIFFWVARMIFMSLEFMEQRPFEKILIHGLVLDKYGKKMSKSRPETIVDPVEIIDNFGADTLRFTLATNTALGQEQRFQMEKVEGSRNFTNKIWNAARFVLMHLEKETARGPVSETKGQEQPELLKRFAAGEIDTIAPEWLELPDQWILSQLQELIANVTKSLEKFDLGTAVAAIYEFLWSEYCDWYIELSKARLNNAENPVVRLVAQGVLVRVLRQTMELLHPFMPFLTEEIWQALPHHGESIVITPWPEVVPGFCQPEAEAEMAVIIETIRALRNIRSEANLPQGNKLPAIFAAAPEKRRILVRNEPYLVNLAGLSEIEFWPEESVAPEKAVSAVIPGIKIFVPLAGLVDLNKERERLQKELAQLEKEMVKLKARLASEAFVGKAPPQVVAKEKDKLSNFNDKVLKIQERLQQLD